MSLKKPFVSALIIVALCTTALTPIGAWAQSFTPQTPDVSQGLDFAQNHSDIKPDPAVRFGKLPNGMTYIIMRNATPPGTASMRLRINGGSMMENDSQQGLAHFLEHMAFNGSKNVPEGDMIKILERHGLAFGPDTNAHTGFGETVYELDLPQVGDDDVDTGLFLLRETAGNLTLDDGAIDRERGVILGEERTSASPGLRAYMKWSADSFGDQVYPHRLPIGKVDVINTAKRDRFVDFYTNFYRPEQSTLVVVGDLDPDAVEAKIKAKFSDWKPAAGPIRVTDFGAYKPKGLMADTYVESGLRDSISMTWEQPIDNHYDTLAKSAEDLKDSIRLAIVNDRLDRQSKLAETSFAVAGVGHGDIEHTSTETQLDITPKPGKDKAALTEAYTTVRQFVEFGADQSELDRILTNYEAAYKAALQGEKTRANRSVAEGLVDSVAENDVFTSPTQDYAYFQQLKPSLTLAAINEGIKPLFSGDGPFLWHENTELGDLDKQGLLDTYNAVQSAKMTAAEARADKPWPYTEFGKASAVVKRVELKDIGVTQLTYANGVVATIKPTKFKEDEVNVTVSFAGGLKALSPAANPPVFAATAGDIFDGGLGKLTASEAKDSLTGKIVGVSYGLGEDAATLSGGTTHGDFATEMQVLMAFTTDAGYRADAFERLKSFIPSYYTQLNSSPQGVFQMNYGKIMHAGDPRFVMPSQDDFLKTSNDQVKALIDRQLKTGPVEVTIVGDITEAEAELEIAKTFATLPPRKDTPLPADGPVVKFPTTNLTQVFEHHGRADQDQSFIAWPTGDLFSDMQRARTAQLLSDVLTLRLTDVVREKLGIAYSPYATSSASLAFKGYGYIAASAGVKPENDQAFYDAVAAIVADLKANPISDDELLRARKPELDRLANDVTTNAYWAGVLPGTARDPRRIEAIRTRKVQLMAVTPADLQKLAVDYLDMAKAVRIQVKPAADATPVDPSAPAEPAAQ